MNINNKLISNNKKNKNTKKDELIELKSLNSIKSCNQNNINNGNNIEDKNGENIDNIAYQTYSVPFRKNIIKVNMVEKEKDNQKPINEDNNIDNDLINPNIKNIIYKNNNGNKSSTNLKTSLNSIIKKNDKKDFYF